MILGAEAKSIGTEVFKSLARCTATFRVYASSVGGGRDVLRLSDNISQFLGLHLGEKFGMPAHQQRID
jgi:hypothetical protein